MLDDFDEELSKLLGAQQAKAQQLTSSIDTMAAMLGEFRTALVNRGFSSVAAEDLARDWFAELLDVGVHNESDDEDDE